MFKKKLVCPKLSYRLKDRGKKKSILTKLHAKSTKKKKCSHIPSLDSEDQDHIEFCFYNQATRESTKTFLYSGLLEILRRPFLPRVHYQAFVKQEFSPHHAHIFTAIRFSTKTAGTLIGWRTISSVNDAGELSILAEWTRNLSLAVHKDQFKMGQRLKCKPWNYWEKAWGQGAGEKAR